MPLIKKCQFFLSLFLVKTRQEIRFNNFLDTKEPFFDYKRKISQGPKNRIFPKGLTHFKVPKMVFLQRGSPMLLAKKRQFFLCLFLVKTRLEIRFNYVLDTKQPLFDYNPWFWSISLFGFGQNNTRNKV